MSKRIIAVLFLFAAPLFLFAQSETIVINNSLFKSKSRSPVKFNHSNHMTIEGVSCTDCHHRYENGKNVLDPSELTENNKAILCNNCHTSAPKLEKAYHDLCIGCHESMIKKNKATGPRLCGECHK